MSANADMTEGDMTRPPEEDMGGEDMTDPPADMSVPDMDTPPARACTPDPNLVDARLACQTDDTCPCGTSCDLGVCVALCSEDADCGAGEVCDTYGRCRLPAQADQIVLPSEVTEGALEPVQNSLVLPALESVPVTFRVVAATTRARVAAQRGAEVRCPGSQDFAFECVIEEALPVGSELTLDVRRATSPMDGHEVIAGEIAAITVFTDGGSKQVTLPGLEEVPGYLPAEQRGLLSSSVDGVYSGRLVLASAGSDQGMGPSDTGMVFDMDVQARVWSENGDAIIEIVDPFDLLTAEGSLIGNFSVDEITGRGTASFPTAPFLDVRVAGRNSKLLAETMDAVVLTSDKPRSLSLSITQRYIGTGAMVAPAVKWVLDLRRDGDVTGAAPAIPMDAELGYDPVELLEQNTPWEQVFVDRMDDMVASPDSASTAELGEAFKRFYRFEEVFSTNFLKPRGLSNPEGLLGGLEGAFTGFLSLTPHYSPNDPDVRSPLAAEWQALLTAHPQVSNGERVYTDVFSTTEDFPISEKAFHCRFQTLTLGLTVNGVARESTLNLIDACGAFERRFGCKVEPFAQAKTTNMAASLETSSGDSGSLTVTGVATHGCKFPSASVYAGEAVLCFDPPEQDSYADFDRGLLSQSVHPTIGDLACLEGSKSVAFPLDLAVGLDGEEIRGNCLDEVSQYKNAPIASPGTETSSGFASTYPSASCVDVPRVLTAIALQSHTLRLKADDQGVNLDAEIYSSALAHRLLTRWVKLHAYFGNEGDQLALMATALAQVANPVPTLPLGEFYEGALGGWDLLYAPHVLNALMVAPAEAYADPDYRMARFGLLGDPNDEQHTALAEAMLDAVTRQGKLALTMLEEGVAAPVNERFAPVSSLLPRAVVANAIASHMRARAMEADPNFLWNDGFISNQRRASSSLRELLAKVDNIRRGANPLGIDDEDLPLYFDAAANGNAGSKFAAISDFLAGRNNQSAAWAPVAIARAEQSLEDAREAFIAEHDRNVRDAHNGRDFARWTEDVRDEYNAVLRDYCGPVGDSIVDRESFDPKTCGIAEDPACQTDFNGWYERWTQADLMGRICIQREITERSLGDVGFYEPDVRTFVEQCVGSDTSATDVVSIVNCSADGSKKCLRCDGGANVGEVALGANSLEIAFPEIDQSDDSSRAFIQSILSDCRDEHPTMNLNVPLPTKNLEQPGCIGGSLGSAYLDIVAAERDLQEARASIEELTESYDIAFESCLILDEANSSLQEARAAHTENMVELRRAKGAADVVATVAAGVKECAATSAGGGESPITAIKSAVFQGIACGAGAVETGANVVSIALEGEIENAQQRHDDNVAAIEGDADVAICFNDARQELVGLKTAAIQVERAAFDLSRAKADYEEMLVDAQRVYEDGNSYLKDVEGWPIPDPAGDLWSDEKVTSYVKDFKLARRATYLAVRAVEYEFQASLGVRQEVFEARTPAALRQNVLEVLWQDANTRGINGSMPSELNSVVSLRDDIFRLGDESNYPEAFRKLTPAERFKILLSNPNYAVYEDGQYIGQRIPFTLAPLGALGYETRGVAIFAQNDCAERLWSLNASILGQDLYKGSDTSNVRIDVLKRNTFFSQWCSTPGQGQDRFQIASVRPNRNLFREPGAGANVGSSQGADRGVEAFSRARVQAFFNVPRAELEDPQYDSGETGELAARGLYGDYALFIPAAQISRNGSNGLVFENIEDILIRLDYVSVASN